MYSNLTVYLCDAKGPQTTVGVVTINHFSINSALTAIAPQYFIDTCSKGEFVHKYTNDITDLDTPSVSSERGVK